VNVLGGDPNLQHDVWQIPVLALAEDDVCTLPDGEARRRNGDLVRAGWMAERRRTRVVRDRLASRVVASSVSTALAFEPPRCSRHRRAAERTARVLRRRAMAASQDRNEQPAGKMASIHVIKAPIPYSWPAAAERQRPAAMRRSPASWHGSFDSGLILGFNPPGSFYSTAKSAMVFRDGATAG